MDNQWIVTIIGGAAAMVIGTLLINFIFGAFRTVDFLYSKIPVLRTLWETDKNTYKRRLHADSMCRMHENFAHSLRTYIIDVAHQGRLSCPTVIKMLDDTAEMMQYLTFENGQKVHACLKVLRRNVQDKNDPFVLTVARSQVGCASGRSHMIGAGYMNEVSKNTAFCAIFGKSDGRQTWHKKYNSFSSNDLMKHIENFKCARPDWFDYYKSTIAYPIRCYPPEGNEYIYIGLLTFDTENEDGFPGVPCTFDFDSVGAYTRACSKSAVWSFGALVADLLAGSVVPYIELQEEGQ